MLYSLSFLPSVVIAFLYADGQWGVFSASLVITAVAGLMMWLPNIRQRSELSVRDGFLVVTLFWVILGVVGALPFLLGLHLGMTDAVFESVSGFTTTGARGIVGRDQRPPSNRYHRQQILPWRCGVTATGLPRRGGMC